MNVAITGGSGVLGKELLKHLGVDCKKIFVFKHTKNEIGEIDPSIQVKLLRSLNDPLFSQPTDPSIGATASEADVSIVEFFDYRCGYCRRAHSSIVELIKTDSKIRVVLKEFPILGPDSVSAAMISLSANMINPEKYADLHDRLIQHQGPYDEATLLALAADVGYDPAGIQAAMTNKALTTQIENARQIAEALNIRGTPAFIIGDKIIPGAVPLQQLRAAIEEARTRAEKRLVN